MSDITPQDHISKKLVVYQIPGMDDVIIRRDVEYRVTDAGPLTMDLYYPPTSAGADTKSGARIPGVVFVSGYSDRGMQAIVGCKLKEMGSYISWGKLTAASGMVAITYSALEPTADLHALLDYLRRNAEELGIDDNRIGVWACSGNVPNALSLLMEAGNRSLKFAVLFYGLMLDLDGGANVAAASKMFGFANPAAGKTVEDLPQHLPLFIARAGADTPQLNETLDRFVAKALARDLPITFVNHPAAPHAFDIFTDSALTREIIRQALAFMRFHLSA
jgi:dienelactone hydrolase